VSLYCPGRETARENTCTWQTWNVQNEAWQKQLRWRWAVLCRIPSWEKGELQRTYWPIGTQTFVGNCCTAGCLTLLPYQGLQLQWDWTLPWHGSGVVDWSAISKASGTFCWVTKTMPKLSKRQANNRKTEAYIIKKARTIQDKVLMSSSCVFYFSNWEGLELWSHLRVLLPVLGSGLLLRHCLQSWTAGNFGISKICPNSSPRFQPVSRLKGSDEDHLNLAMITPCSSATPKLKWHLSCSIICWWDIKLPRTLLLPDT